MVNYGTQLLPVGSYADQTPALAYGLEGTAGITGLLAGVANVAGQRVDIPVIGDSITEGRGATAFNSRWVYQANKAVRAAYPTTAAGGLGFIPLQNTGTITYTWPVTLASGSTGGVQALGPVRNGAILQSACVFQWTAPAGTTSVKIAHYDFGDAAVWSYQVASGTVVNITQNTGAGELITGSIPITAGQVLTISWVSGFALVEGIVHYAGDEAGGITIHGCGHSGWQAGQPADNNGWNYAGSSVPWQQSLANLITGAGAVGIFLGANDSTYYSAAQYQANMETLITALQSGYGNTSLAGYPLLLIVPYQVQATFVSGSWGPYAAAVRSVAAAVPNTQVIDLNYRMPSVAADWDGGELYADTFHPTNLGHALVGAIAGAGLRIA